MTGKFLGAPDDRLELVVRARAVGKDYDFKKVNDEETKHALFPSNYPPV